jgi:hypothetical protein
MYVCVYLHKYICIYIYTDSNSETDTAGAQTRTLMPGEHLRSYIHMYIMRSLRQRLVPPQCGGQHLDGAVALRLRPLPPPPHGLRGDARRDALRPRGRWARYALYPPSPPGPIGRMGVVGSACSRRRVLAQVRCMLLRAPDAVMRRAHAVQLRSLTLTVCLSVCLPVSLYIYIYIYIDR